MGEPRQSDDAAEAAKGSSTIRPIRDRKKRPVFSDEDVRQWVQRTCAEQGLPFHVTDPATIARVAATLRSAREERLRRLARAESEIK